MKRTKEIWKNRWWTNRCRRSDDIEVASPIWDFVTAEIACPEIQYWRTTNCQKVARKYGGKSFSEEHEVHEQYTTQ